MLDVGLPHHLVIQAVERAFYDCHAVTLGVAARGAHRTHHRLGARVGKAHLVDVGAHGFDLLDHRGVEFGREARERAALGDLLNHCVVHALIAVTQDDGAVA